MKKPSQTVDLEANLPIIARLRLCGGLLSLKHHLKSRS